MFLHQVQAVSKFQATKEQYAGMIHNRFEYEVEDLTAQLVKQADVVGGSWNPKFIRMYDYSHLTEIVTGVIDALQFSGQTFDDHELAIRFGISAELVIRVRQHLTINPAYVSVSLTEFPYYEVPKKVVKTVLAPFDTHDVISEQEFTGAATAMPILKVRR